MNYYDRRIFNFSTWLLFTLRFILYLPGIVSIKFSNRISKSLQEKLLLSTTSINKCLLCARFASEMAFKDGVTKAEILTILNFDLDGINKCNEDDLIALLYAQNYAETNCNPSADILNRLNEYYGKNKAKDIIVLTNKSHFFNLCGNTYSAFISRVKGIKARNSNLLFEIFFFIIHSPIIIPSWIYVKLKRNDFSFE